MYKSKNEISKNENDLLHNLKVGVSYTDTQKFFEKKRPKGRGIKHLQNLRRKFCIKKRIEESVLVILIVLSIFDFFGYLSADLEYIKTIMSITIIGYLMYRASFTKIFFNNKNAKIDLMIILSYFLLILKNIVFYSSDVKNYRFFYDLQLFILNNSNFVEYYSFTIGSLMLAVISIFIAIKLKITSPSLFYAIRKNANVRKNGFEFVTRFFIILFILLGFFIMVFNLLIEWLIVIDTPIIVFTLILSFIFILKHYKRFKVNNLIFRIGYFTEKIYPKFISLFHSKTTLFFGISGILVFHLIADLVNFLIPYAINFTKSPYILKLGESHLSLLELFIAQSKGLMLTEKIFLGITYILNIAGLSFLLLFPPYLWYISLKNNKKHMNKYFIIFVMISLFLLAISPVFSFEKIIHKGIIGFDILTKAPEIRLFSNHYYIILISIIIFLTMSILYKKIEKFLLSVIIISSLIFFAVYIYLFNASSMNYYSESIISLYESSKYFTMGIFSVFFVFTILFYVGGFVIFLKQIINAEVFKKLGN